MSKITITGFTLLLLLFLGNSSGNYAAASATAAAARDQLQRTTPESQPARRGFDQGETGTLQKMIVQSGSVTMQLDLNRLNGIGFALARPATLQFTVAANSFFTILVFNDLLRGPDHGSMALVPQNSAPALPVSLGASIRQLVVEKLSSDAGFDLAVRDGKTGFTFFNIDGGQYDYDANAQLLSITGGRLLVSKELAESLGRPADADAGAGEISIGATMQPIETMQLDQNGDVKSGPFPAPTSSLAS